jgi:hypothetical protein
LPNVTQAPTFASPYFPPKPKTERNLIIAIIAIVVVAVIIVGALGAVFLSSFVASLPKTDVYISAVNDHWDFTVTASNGLQTASQPISGYDTSNVAQSYAEGQTFSYSLTIPPLNDSSCSSISVTISTVSLETTGFTLDSVSPNLPITYNAGSVTISLTVSTPHNPYGGVLGVLLTGSVYCTV